MKTILKLVVAIILLLCLADMPYGFYTLVRFVSAFAFAYLSYDYFKSKKDGLGFVFAALALLFQPFFKVALGRTIWNIVDVIVAVGLLYLLISTFKKKGNDLCTKYLLLWFIKVKNVKSSSFSHSIESAESLFYRLRHKKLIINDLQILKLQWSNFSHHP